MNNINKIYLAYDLHISKIEDKEKLILDYVGLYNSIKNISNKTNVENINNLLDWNSYANNNVLNIANKINKLSLDYKDSSNKVKDIYSNCLNDEIDERFIDEIKQNRLNSKHLKYIYNVLICKCYTSNDNYELSKLYNLMLSLDNTTYTIKQAMIIALLLNINTSNDVLNNISLDEYNIIAFALRKLNKYNRLRVNVFINNYFKNRVSKSTRKNIIMFFVNNSYMQNDIYNNRYKQFDFYNNSSEFDEDLEYKAIKEKEINDYLKQYGAN